MSEIRIRVANEEDIDQMTQLDATCFSSPWSRASFTAELTNNPLAWYLVGETPKYWKTNGIKLPLRIRRMTGLVSSLDTQDCGPLKTKAISPTWRFIPDYQTDAPWQHFGGTPHRTTPCNKD